MRCRKIINGELIFFNSAGIDSEGKAVKVMNIPEDNASWFEKHPSSYAGGIDGVNQSLYQRLSLIQGELPHFMNTGFPLFNKNADKAPMDAYLIDVLTHYPDVISIEQIDSKVEKHNYTANVKIKTVYGDLNFIETEII